MKFLGGRVLHSVLLLFAVSVLSFLFASLAPGDFYSTMRTDPRVSQQTVENMRERAGINRPLAAQYVDWVASAARGDWGYSLAFSGPVGPLLWPRIRATLLLTITATVLAWLIAAPLGIWNATARGSWRGRAFDIAVTLLLAVPDLLLALALLVVAVETGAFPVGGMVSRGFDAMTLTDRLCDLAWHMVLPVAVLALGMLPVLIRHVRASMLEAIDAPFALSARAHGIPRRRLLFRHLLPAATGPLVALLGVSLGTLLSMSLLIEVVMGWPGLGPFFLEAIMARDFAVVLAVVMLSAAVLIFGNLAADLLLYRVDPRIRTESL